MLVACALAAPVAAFAQTTQVNNAPVTRAQVIADLVRVEQAGYQPAAKDINYPGDIQHAESIVAQEQVQNGQQAAPENNSVGGVTMTGSSDMGARAIAGVDARSIYAGR
jgi:hypothetical protein